MVQLHGVLILTLPEMSQFLVLLVHRLMLTISRIIFLVPSEVLTSGFSECFGSPEKKRVLILLQQTQNFTWVCIIMQMIFTCLLTGNKNLSLRRAMKKFIFQLNSVSKEYLMDLVLLSLEWYHFFSRFQFCW